MRNWTDEQFRQVLAAWLNVVKSPYFEAKDSQKSYEIQGGSNLDGIHSRILLQENDPQLVEVEIIHTLHNLGRLVEHSQVHHDIAQFNTLMENVKLPTFVWFNAEGRCFELHWQERLGKQAELMFIKQLYTQSFQLAYCLSNKLAWQHQDEDDKRHHMAH